jgi:hypothetical protein
MTVDQAMLLRQLIYTSSIHCINFCFNTRIFFFYPSSQVKLWEKGLPPSFQARLPNSRSAVRFLICLSAQINSQAEKVNHLVVDRVEVDQEEAALPFQAGVVAAPQVQVQVQVRVQPYSGFSQYSYCPVYSSSVSSRVEIASLSANTHRRHPLEARNLLCNRE